jgi:hypothetical protein
MKAQETFLAKSYEKLKSAIEGIPVGDRPDIYAISLWYHTEGDDPRYPKVIVGYNTESNFRENIRSASDEAEARWNFAFWLQNETDEIGGEEDRLLHAWFAESPYYYTDEQNEEASDDDDLFDELLDKGSQFDEEFIDAVITLTQRLFDEGVITSVFGKDIPVLIHELEYYEAPVSWTVRANPQGLADEFAKWVEGL